MIDLYENRELFLAFGKSVPVWGIGAVLGWIVIPIMAAITGTYRLRANNKDKNETNFSFIY
jgi:hypothetical protein